MAVLFLRHLSFICVRLWSTIIHLRWGQLSLAWLLVLGIATVSYGQIQIQPRIVAYRPLHLVVPASDLHALLQAELGELSRDEIRKDNVTFRFEQPVPYFEGGSRLRIETTVHAKTRIPIVGTVRAKARAKLWALVTIRDWRVQVEPQSSDIKFSNDLINLAFQLVRKQVEERLVNLARDSLAELNQTIEPGSSRILKLVQQRGRLDGGLEPDGLHARLTERSR